MMICKQVKSRILKHFPDMDEDLLSYLVGYISDTDCNEFSTQSDIFASLHPFLTSANDCNEQRISELCEELSSVVMHKRQNSLKNENEQFQLLSSPIQISSLIEQQQQQQQSDKQRFDESDRLKFQKSNVDLEKLKKVEAKLAAKRERKNLENEKILSRVFVPVLPTANQRLGKGAATNSSEVLDAKCSTVIIEGIDIGFGGRTLLANADLNLSRGRRYGLVGRNGVGKSTLLSMISKGELKIPKSIRMICVEQEVLGDDTMVIDCVLAADIVRLQLLQREALILKQLKGIDKESGESPALADSKGMEHELTEIYSKLSEIEADKAPSRASHILYGLGFSSDDLIRPSKEFSGGWRMRISLAYALFGKPDFLLLDEPTNMLDIKAIIWLKNHLIKNWSDKILLVVSHDRQFLDDVSTDIIHYHSLKLDTCRGNYSNFVKNSKDRLLNQQREYEAQMAYRAHLKEFIDKFRYNAKRASQAQMKIKILEKLPKLEPVIEEKCVGFKFCEDCDTNLSPPILQLDEADFSYPTEPENYIFQNVNISADFSSRVCIVGENGSGKTTLIRLLLGDLEPVAGRRNVSQKLNIGFFTQHHIDQLDMNLSPLELACKNNPLNSQDVLRSSLSRFGITSDLASNFIGSLSGGQKSRVAFAMISLKSPNFLIFDEPTNHLDVESVESLGEALNEFKGGVVLVSHDKRLIEIVCRELWVCSKKIVKRLEGGFPEYERLMETEVSQFL